MTVQEEQQVKISSPEKVARLLDKVAESGLPLMIRSVASPTISVKGRAISNGGSVRDHGLMIGNISERGIKFLVENAQGGVQVEFVLMSSKVVFFTSISHFNRQDCIVNLPAFLTSIERRKDSRYFVAGNNRAFMGISSFYPEIKDTATHPFFESSKELCSLIPVGDVSMGGISLVSRFPAACKFLDRGHTLNEAEFHLPLSPPIIVDASVRWCKRLKETVVDTEGKSRVIRVYKFGIQFMQPTEELLRSIQGFIQKLSQADAI